MVGIPTYGRGFTLVSTNDTAMGAAASGASSAGAYTGEAGFYSYYEVIRVNILKI